MNIAIIENDSSILQELKKTIEEFEWSSDFFTSSIEFGYVDLGKYDVIIADCDLPTLNGRDLLNAICIKTSAQLFLMGDSSTCFKEEDVKNVRIAGLIEKEKVSNVVEELKYIDTKLRIHKCIEAEEGKNGNVILTQNGYTFKIQDKIGVLGISNILSRASKEKILKELDQYEISQMVIYFVDKEIVSSSYLAELVFFYKALKVHDGKIAFWNSSKKSEVINQIRICCLDRLFPAFDDLDKAISFLKS